jgi:hypothetical protein
MSVANLISSGRAAYGAVIHQSIAAYQKGIRPKRSILTGYAQDKTISLDDRVWAIILFGMVTR